GEFLAAAWSPDGRWLAASADREIQLWDATSLALPDGPLPTLQYRRESHNWYGLSWSADSRWLASATLGAVFTCDVRAAVSPPFVQSWTSVATFRDRSTPEIAWSPVGAYLAVASRQEVRVWKQGADRLEAVWSDDFDGRDWFGVEGLAWSPD